MLPDWLQQKLASPPAAGAGIHAWLFSVARQLHAHMPSDAIGAVLQAATATAGRHVTQREIRDAVNNSHAVSWQPKPFSGGVESRHAKHRNNVTVVTDAESRSSARPAENPSDRWPAFDPAGCYESILRADLGLVDLWERSPVRVEDWGADDWLDWLFPDAEWLCLAVDHPATARSRKREAWSFGPADGCGLVVPSPMTGPSGNGLDGRRSHRCLDNTGPRRWLVVEFDFKGKTFDDQAALHWSVAQTCAAMGWPPLRLVVHSGGKSLHGWFGPISSEEAAKELMEYASLLGADTATWNRCQLVRLPGGSRSVTGIPATLPDDWERPGASVRLEVLYFDPR